MKKINIKILKLITLFFATIICLIGCNKEKKFLIGTQWKLVGIVDMETDSLEELEPKDCVDCYSLKFLTNTKAEGIAFREKIVLDLKLLGKYEITDINRTDEDDRFVKLLYCINTDSYSFTSIELKIINETDKFYLLFKKLNVNY